MRLFACLVIFACGHASPISAEVLPSSSNWDACIAAPTRSCVLREALVTASASATPSSYQLGRIAEAYVRAGDIDTAFRIIPLIHGDGPARASVLRSVASAEAKNGRIDKARDIFAQALLLADTIEAPLARVEARLSIAKDEEAAGFMAEANSLFMMTRELAEAVEIRPAPDRGCTMPSQEDRLAVVHGGLARHDAKVGDLRQALELARRIQYSPGTRVAALQAIAEIMAGAGRSDDARDILNEARDSAGPAAPWLEQHPSCPSMHFRPPDASYYVHSLCQVAKVQAKLGLIDAATATLDAVSRLIADIVDGPVLAHVAAVGALTEIAEADSEVGLAARAREDLDRAIKVAADVKATDTAGLYTVTRLARALVRSGRSEDAQRLLKSMLIMVRSSAATLDRANGLLHLVETRDDVGLSSDRNLLLETQDAVRAVPSEASILLVRLAQAWLRAGEMPYALANFDEALAPMEAMNDRKWIWNLLQQMVRGIPIPDFLAGRRDPKLTAAAAPHIMKIIQASGNLDGQALSGRTEVLLSLAGALPN